MPTKLAKYNNLIKILLHGLLIVVALIVIQLVLDNAKESFMSFLPPLGFGFYMIASYIIQPIIIGALNIIVLHQIYKIKGWQVGFWLNGIFLLLAFSTINLMLQTALRLPFSPYIVLIDFFVLSFPFGLVAKFSNGGWKKPIN
jgi:hypothetical protein